MATAAADFSIVEQSGAVAISASIVPNETDRRPHEWSTTVEMDPPNPEDSAFTVFDRLVYLEAAVRDMGDVGAADRRARIERLAMAMTRDVDAPGGLALSMVVAARH
ncbi:hypothetical protein [Paludisphaera soli]|uniref:hypothetical protein n=1 Tax=Paludisphaera soli TaxID=2712865 RepID=UPI0013ED270E|nr:hypothetical protein [Paludisphaera soli]